VIANKSGETGAWAKQGGGTLRLGGISTYTGATAINNGTLQLTTGNDRLPTGTTVSLGQAASANVGTFDLNARSQQIAGLNSTTGTNATASNNTVTSSSAATLTLGGSGNYSYGDGTDANSGVITGAISVVKSGSGTQTFGDANTYSGTTTISSGTLALGASGSLASSLISVASGASFDFTAKTGGLTLGTGQQLGGRGTVLGSLEFGSGSQLGFSSSGPLLVGSGTVSFAAGFGIGSIAGLDSSVAEGTYTLLNETTGGTISFANLANVGAGNAFDLGSGKSAYFQQGSLQVVVVPEPSTLGLAAAGLALAALGAWRRRAGRTAPAA
jgi:autotransporter-associated beta strand protein